MPQPSLIVLFAIAGVLAAGVVIHAANAADREQRRRHLLLAALCLFAALNVVLHAALIVSPDAAAFIERRRWRTASGSVFLLLYPWCLLHLCQLRDRVLPTLIGVAALTLALRAALHAGDPWLSAVERFAHLPTPWGEPVATAHGPASPFLAIAALAWIGMALYAAVCAWRHGRQPGAIGAGALLAVNLVFVLTLLNDLGNACDWLSTPPLSQFALGLLPLALWWRSAREQRRQVQSWRELFDHGGDAHLVLSAEGGAVVAANQAAALLFGRRTWNGVGWHDLIAGGGAGDFPADGTRVLELRARHADGSPIPVAATLRRTLLDGRPCLAAALRDLSSQERARAELSATRHQVARQEAWLQGIVEHAADGICVLAIAGGGEPEVRLWNPRMQAITGRSREQVAALGFVAALHDEAGRAAAATHLAQLRAGQALRDQDCTLVHADGSRRDCLVSTSFLPADDGQRLVLALVRDVSALRRQERERRELEARVQQAQKLESLGVLAGGIAHDFNNILMTVLGRADLLLRGDRLDAAGRAEVGEIRTAAHRASDLCRQLLAYAGKGRVSVAPLDLAALVREMADLLAVSISKKVRLDLDLAAVPPVQGDAAQLRQVVMNLITNAAEAINDQPGTISVCTAEADCTRAWLDAAHGGAAVAAGRLVMLTVADSGCGMDAATRSRIFEPFFTTKFTGRGLGLSAVLGIVEGHGGALHLETAPGAGTRFQVVLPPTAAAPAPAPVATPPSDGPFVGGQALIVDDEPLVRMIAAEMLAGLGFTAVIATTAAEALERFVPGVTALVILDLTLPDRDGDAVFRDLRARDPGVRVIVASGYTRDEVMQRFAGLAGVVVLQKPYDLAGLEQAMRTLLVPTRR